MRWSKPSGAFAPLVLLAACSGSGGGTGNTHELDSEPETISHVREIHHFESLEEMVATSDLVVLAEVADVQPGRWHGDPGAEDSTQSRAVTLSVEQVLWSGERPANSFPTTLTLDEEGWTSEGRGFQLEGLPWLNVGDSGVFAVDIDLETGNVFLVNTQSRFLLDGPTVVPSGAKSAPLARQTRDLKREELLDEFEDAVAAVRAGGVSPDTGPKGRRVKR